MRNLILVLAGALAVAALLATSVARPAAQADGDPQIVLSSITVDLTPDQPAEDYPIPTSVQLGYGLLEFDLDGHMEQHPEDSAVFFSTPISPSPLAQTLVAEVATDPVAATLASDLLLPPPAPPAVRSPEFLYRITPGFITGKGGPDFLLHIPPGAQIDHFKMTVVPFTIEERIVDPFHGGAPTFGQATNQPRVIIAPYSVYRMITEGPVATIEAYGAPPPGDATCDAIASSIDALVVEQHDAGLLDALPCAKAADANGDGNVDTIDASLILQFTAGLIPVP